MNILIPSCAASLAADLHERGYAIIPAVLTPGECDRLLANLARLEFAGAGTRSLLALPWCAAIAKRLATSASLAPLLPADAVCAQCTYFDKSPERNWLVPLHQDLSIPVAARVAGDVVLGWSEKEGQLFAQPPTEVLESLLAVRLQLDAPASEDGALRVVPGSHGLGRLDDRQAAAAREARGEAACVVERGAALLMRPLLLHASSKLKGSRPRRVLHFLFGPAALPCGLRWPDASLANAR